MKENVKKKEFRYHFNPQTAIKLLLFSIILSIFFFYTSFLKDQVSIHIQNETTFQQQATLLSKKLRQAKRNLQDLKDLDQYKINQQLTQEIKNIHDTFMQANTIYEKLVDVKLSKADTKDMDALYAGALANLAEKNYASAESKLTTLNSQIQQELAKIAAASIPQASAQTNAPASNSPPSSGFSVQKVSTDHGDFTLSIVAADLNSTRVIVDTASDGDCSNNCPTLPLSDYVSRSGAFAGINGTFFCPPEYPSCAGKTNSFDTLLMNKNKHYFNSANNVYSTVPLVFFTGNTMGVRGRSSDWGRATDVDSVIAMQPLLISGGNITYTSSSDTKFTNKGTRDFIAAKGSTVYMGVIYNANMSDAAIVLKVLGMDNALNLDEGGSTALWYGGYKAGPGRNIPNAVLFIRK